MSYPKRVKCYTEVSLNKNLEIRGTCTEFKGGKKRLGKKKKVR